MERGGQKGDVKAGHQVLLLASFIERASIFCIAHGVENSVVDVSTPDTARVSCLLASSCHMDEYFYRLVAVNPWC